MGFISARTSLVLVAMAHTPHRRVILDMDSSESPVHGQQEGAAYNGHFEYLPEVPPGEYSLVVKSVWEGRIHVFYAISFRLE